MIGYGIVASVMTTDVDLSKEVVGLHFVLWKIAVSALPLVWLPIHYFDKLQKASEEIINIDLPSYGYLVAQSLSAIELAVASGALCLDTY